MTTFILKSFSFRSVCGRESGEWSESNKQAQLSSLSEFPAAFTHIELRSGKLRCSVPKPRQLLSFPFLINSIVLQAINRNHSFFGENVLKYLHA